MRILRGGVDSARSFDFEDTLEMIDLFPEKNLEDAEDMEDDLDDEDPSLLFIATPFRAGGRILLTLGVIVDVSKETLEEWVFKILPSSNNGEFGDPLFLSPPLDFDEFTPIPSSLVLVDIAVTSSTEPDLLLDFLLLQELFLKNGIFLLTLCLLKLINTSIN